MAVVGIGKKSQFHDRILPIVMYMCIIQDYGGNVMAFFQISGKKKEKIPSPAGTPAFVSRKVESVKVLPGGTSHDRAGFPDPDEFAAAAAPQTNARNPHHLRLSTGQSHCRSGVSKGVFQSWICPPVWIVSVSYHVRGKFVRGYE